MRIIAGTRKGRIFAAPPGARTHPMSDKIRGALFNILGDIAGLTVLDAFGGSGALAFEAISRGARSTVVIESDRTAQKTITQNTQSLGLQESVQLVTATANAWLTTTNTCFDIVLLDPPYQDVQPNLLTKLAARAKAGGVIVLSLPPTTQFALPVSTYEQLAIKSYGDATLAFYRRSQ